MPLKHIILLVAVIISFGCKKTDDPNAPAAFFTTDKEEYLEGEMITLSNNSERASYYKWTMPDGQISAEINASYRIPVASQDRDLEFTLEAFTADRSASDILTKKIPVKVQRGSLYLFQFGTGSKTYRVTVDQTSSEITLNGSSVEPECGGSIPPIFSLKPGNHTIEVFLGTNSIWQGPITIESGKCVKIGL